MYSPSQLAALSLLGGVLVPLAAALTLWRQHAKHKGRTRAYLLYRSMAGVLLGQVLCHTWLPVALGNIDTRLLFACALLGYLLFDAGETIGRAWNSHYVMVDDDVPAELDDACVDGGRMEQQHIASLTGLRDPSFAERAWALSDKERDEHKRQWMLGALFIALACVVLSDALLLVVLPAGDVLILCFYLHGFTLSLALLGGMVHAKFHITAGGRLPRWLWWWGIAGLAWCVGVLVLGVGLPLWLGADPVLVLALLQHPAYMVLYGLCAGVLLKLHVYYYSRRPDPASTRRDMAWGLLCFWLSAAQACLTGFWL